MSQDRKKRHLQKVMTATPQCKFRMLPTTVQSTSASSSKTQGGVLGLSFQDSRITTIAPGTLESIWKKAESHVHNKGHVFEVPWLPGGKARFVKSATTDQPHMVKPNPKAVQQYCCDDRCPMFKGFSLCSHTVAVAQVNNDLQSFVKWYAIHKCRPNLTLIANEGMPKGVGRKEGVPKRKRAHRNPIETTSSRFSNGQSESCVISMSTSPATYTLSYMSSYLIAMSATSLPLPYASTFTSSATSLPGMSTCSTTTTSGILPAINSLQQNPQTSAGALVGSVANLLQQIVRQPAQPSLPSKPFTLKIRTFAIRICQACRQELKDELVVCRPERRLIQNTETCRCILLWQGIQFSLPFISQLSKAYEAKSHKFRHNHSSASK